MLIPQCFVLDPLRHRQRDQGKQTDEMTPLPRSLSKTISPGQKRGPRGRECLVHGGYLLVFAKGREESGKTISENYLF